VTAMLLPHDVVGLFGFRDNELGILSGSREILTWSATRQVIICITVNISSVIWRPFGQNGNYRLAASELILIYSVRRVELRTECSTNLTSTIVRGVKDLWVVYNHESCMCAS